VIDAQRTAKRVDELFGCLAFPEPVPKYSPNNRLVMVLVTQIFQPFPPLHCLIRGNSDDHRGQDCEDRSNADGLDDECCARDDHTQYNEETESAVLSFSQSFRHFVNSRSRDISKVKYRMRLPCAGEEAQKERDVLELRFGTAEAVPS
jgi:hypothetical protein